MHIKSSYTIEQVTIFNSIGQEVINQNKNLDTIHVTNLTRGIYFMKIQTNGGLYTTKKNHPELTIKTLEFITKIIFHHDQTTTLNQYFYNNYKPSS